MIDQAFPTSSFPSYATYWESHLQYALDGCPAMESPTVLLLILKLIFFGSYEKSNIGQVRFIDKLEINCAQYILLVIYTNLKMFHSSGMSLL